MESHLSLKIEGKQSSACNGFMRGGKPLVLDITKKTFKKCKKKLQKTKWKKCKKKLIYM